MEGTWQKVLWAQAAPRDGDKHGQEWHGPCSAPHQSQGSLSLRRTPCGSRGAAPRGPPGSIVLEPVVVSWLRWRPEVSQSLLLLLLSSECKLQLARVMLLMLIPRDSASHMLFPFSLTRTMV